MGTLRLRRYFRHIRHSGTNRVWNPRNGNVRDLQNDKRYTRIQIETTTSRNEENQEQNTTRRYFVFFETDTNCTLHGTDVCNNGGRLVLMLMGRCRSRHHCCAAIIMTGQQRGRRRRRRSSRRRRRCRRRGGQTGFRLRLQGERQLLLLLLLLLLLTGGIRWCRLASTVRLVFGMKDDGPAIETNLLGLDDVAQQIERIFATGVAGTPAQYARQIVA